MCIRDSSACARARLAPRNRRRAYARSGITSPGRAVRARGPRRAPASRQAGCAPVWRGSGIDWRPPGCQFRCQRICAAEVPWPCAIRSETRFKGSPVSARDQPGFLKARRAVRSMKTAFLRKGVYVFKMRRTMRLRRRRVRRVYVSDDVVTRPRKPHNRRDTSRARQ